MSTTMSDAEKLFREAYERHMANWGPHCGAPLEVYEGHLRKLLEAYRRWIEERAAGGDSRDRVERVS